MAERRPLSDEVDAIVGKCEECGINAPIVTVVIDGDEQQMCDPCAGWWLNHGL